MLSFFRSKRSSWIVFALLGLVLLAIVITGFGTRGSGLGDLGTGPARLATVDGQAITERDFTTRLNSELNTARQQQPELDMAGFIKTGAFDALLQTMIDQRAQVATAEDHGLTASKRMVDGVIAGIPAFKDAAGKFDERLFRGALNQAGTSESRLREDIHANLMRRQLLMPMIVGARMPDSLKRHYASLLLETRTGAIGAVPLAAVGPGQEPTDADIVAYFKAHQARYMIPERRVLRYAIFGRADVAAAAKVSEAEIATAYKQDSALYGPRETRAVAQLTLPDRAAANAFAAKVKGGKSFADAAKEAGFTPADVARSEGTKAELTGALPPPVAEAAFSAAQGALIGPIQSPFGWHVARVEKATSIPAKPLAAVRDDIVKKIEEQKGGAALDALAARIEDAIADDGANFAEVLKANNLQAIETQPVTAAGAAPGSDYQLPVEAKPLLKSAFGLASDDPPQVETLVQGQRYALVGVSRIVPPAAPPLAQIRDRIKGDIVRERSAKRAKALADKLVAQINAGTPIRDAFARAGVALPPVQNVAMQRLEANRGGEKTPPPIRLIFNLPTGKARAQRANDGTAWFVVLAEKTTPGNQAQVGPLLAQLGPSFDSARRDEYLEQTVGAAEQSAKVKRNEGAIATLRTRLLTGAAAN
jgi:peptidyl-prolyl cis-trans isomerase D